MTKVSGSHLLPVTSRLVSQVYSWIQVRNLVIHILHFSQIHMATMRRSVE